MLHKIAEEADICPYKIDGSKGTPDDVTPHVLPQCVPYRIINTEDKNTLYNVCNRLHHWSIQ